MTDDPLVGWLFRRTAGRIRWGLERTEELLAGVDDPHRRFHALHVGGTNGKGSVAALSAAALRRAPGTGRVGLYTSPHLVDFRERIRIDGAAVAEPVLRDAVETLRPAIERTGATFFEATTAIAFLAFARTGVDVAVVEVGLGGRLDATNVVTPLACCVTNIARDHTEYLGETLPEIAFEKAGIFKPGVPAITAETDPAVVEVLRARAAAVGAPFTTLDEAARLEPAAADGAFLLRSRRWGAMPLRVPMAGPHQRRNAALAAELLALLPPAARPGAADIASAFAEVVWPGRLQRVRAWGANWLLDVAHNPAGVHALVGALPGLDLPRPLVLLCSVLADKEWREMLPPLLGAVDAAVLTTAPSAPPERRWDVDAAARACADGATAVRAIADFPAALQRASTLAGHGTVVVTGSFHTVGDAMAVLGIPTT